MGTCFFVNKISMAAACGYVYLHASSIKVMGTCHHYELAQTTSQLCQKPAATPNSYHDCLIAFV